MLNLSEIKVWYQIECHWHKISIKWKLHGKENQLVIKKLIKGKGEMNRKTGQFYYMHLKNKKKQKCLTNYMLPKTAVLFNLLCNWSNSVIIILKNN